MSAILVSVFARRGTNLGIGRPRDSQVGGSRTERNSQPYIWIRSTSWALMASLWNLKHRHRPERSSSGKSEYQQPFRSACTCSPRVTAPFSSPSPHSQRQRAFSEVIYTLVLCIEWCALLPASWSTIGFLWRAMRGGVKYGFGEEINYVRGQSAAFAVWSVFTSCWW